eukprot:m.21211 g.21211  ORF g.21211 m.21211 type:complete len:164 (+) comp3868_c0_seq2:288-779(+)
MCYTPRPLTHSLSLLCLVSLVGGLRSFCVDDHQSGNGYRVVQNMDGRMDKIVMHAFQEAGVPASVVARSFPANFSIWVDPGNVSVKIGHDGSVWSLDIVSPNDVAPHHFLPDTGAVSHAASPAGTPMKRSHAMAITPSGKHRYRHIDATLMDISNVFVPSWAQ